LGAHIINDISGLKNDANMAKIISDFNAPAILMATKKFPGDCLTFSETKAALVESISLAEDSGINELVIDPGVGRWIPEKTHECDLVLLNNFERFRTIGRPILVAVSRKSFIGSVLGIPEPSGRLAGTLACTAIAVYKGAHVVRTHDVKETMDIVRMAEAVRSKPIAVEKDGYQVVVIDCIQKPEDSVDIMKSINATDVGAEIMKDKTASKVMLIKNVAPPEALILKQEMLARGGDAAIPRGVISGEIPLADVLLIGAVAQIKSVINKLKMQSLNLPMIGDLIQEALQRELGGASWKRK
jgi:dihydropteroate synthase